MKTTKTTPTKPRTEIKHAGATWSFTGKTGTHVATGAASAEYARSDEKGEHRVWAFLDGTVNETDAGMVEGARAPRVAMGGAR